MGEEKYDLEMAFEMHILKAVDAGDCYYIFPEPKGYYDHSVWKINKKDKTVEYLTGIDYMLHVPNKESFIHVDPLELKRIIFDKEA